MTMKTNAVERLHELMDKRNGRKGKGILMILPYGAKLTNAEKDELLICSRIAQRG